MSGIGTLKDFSVDEPLSEFLTERRCHVNFSSSRIIRNSVLHMVHFIPTHFGGIRAERWGPSKRSLAHTGLGEGNARQRRTR